MVTAIYVCTAVLAAGIRSLVMAVILFAIYRSYLSINDPTVYHSIGVNWALMGMQPSADYLGVCLLIVGVIEVLMNGLHFVVRHKAGYELIANEFMDFLLFTPSVLMTNAVKRI